MKKLHFAWVVCLCATLVMLCCMGLSVNAFSVYLTYVMQQWGYSNSQASLFNTVRSLFALAAMPLMAPLFQRTGLRRGLTLACLLTAAAFLLGALAAKPLFFYTSAALMGAGYGLGGVAGTAMLVRRWFKSRLGLALGMCACGSGLAAILAPTLITAAIERFGLRAAFIGEGCIVVLVAALVFVVVRSTPEERGLQPYAAEETTVRKTQRVTCTEPMTRGEWIFFYPALICLGLVAAPATGNFAVHLRGCGFSPMSAALGVSVFGIAVSAAKFLFGVASDRWGCQRATTLFCLLLMSAFALISALKLLPNNVLMVFAMALVGLGYPPTTVGLSLWAGDLNPPEQYDRSVRRFQSGYLLGTVIGSPLPGLLADRFGSYAPAYALMVLYVAVVLVSVNILYRRKFRARIN